MSPALLAAVAAILAASPMAARGANPVSVAVDLAEPADVIVRIGVEEAPGAPKALGVGAVTLAVDGESDQEILLVAGSGRRHYEGILPLDAGAHRLAVRPSGLWPAAAGLRIRSLEAAPVSRDDPRRDAFRFAPRLVLRGDTVGRANDLPLLAYVEEEWTGDERTLRYTLVFSHEDGGTPAAALFARWGRTLDIELAYEVTLRGDVVVAERFQGPGHEIRSFDGRRRARHPVLWVATLNNMFEDRGEAGPELALVPRLVSLEDTTRESVADGEPWIYRMMAQELRDEERLDAAEGVFDPSEYLYAEARLTLVEAAAAVRVGFVGGAGRVSHRGDPDLAVARQGWVRSAVHVGDEQLEVAGWECLALRSAAPAGPPSCVVEVARAFRIAPDGRPGPSLIRPARLELRPGESQLLSVAPRSSRHGRGARVTERARRGRLVEGDGVGVPAAGRFLLDPDPVAHAADLARAEGQRVGMAGAALDVQLQIAPGAELGRADHDGVAVIVGDRAGDVGQRGAARGGARVPTTADRDGRTPQEHSRSFH